MSEPVLSWKRQDAQDAVETLETFDKHGLPAFVRGVDAEALYFFLALFRTGTLPRAAEQLGISLSSANRMLAKLRTYWDDPLFVRSGFLMQPTTAAKRRYDKVLSFMHVLEDLRRDDELDPRTLSRTVRTACYDNAFALCIASIFADFTARMPHVRLRAMQADEHLFDYLREDLLDLVFFARQGLHPDVHSVALLTTPYVCLVRRGHPLSERAAALGPLEREDLEASRRGGRTDFPYGLLVFCGKSGHFSRGGGVLEQRRYEGPFYGPHAFCRGHLHDGRSARTDIRMGTRPAAALRLSAVFRHFVCRLFRLALF